MADPYVRPETPQAMIHRLPDKPVTADNDATRIFSKYIVVVIASTAVAGKAQIARDAADALECPLFQGDSLFQTAAKAASVGASTSGGANEGRFQRMWLSKMTRTGLLFPEESRPATSGFLGFDGSSTSSSRRGSSSSTDSVAAFTSITGSSSSVSSSSGSSPSARKGRVTYVNKPTPIVSSLAGDDELQTSKILLMVLTHPPLEPWHRACIRDSVGEYGIGVIFAPLEDIQDDTLPVLQPLDAANLSGFSSFDQLRAHGSLDGPDKELVVSVMKHRTVEEITGDVVLGVRNIMAD